MPIPGQENINIGAENEAANSDSLFTAFNKAQNNFTTLFSESSQYTNFTGGQGIETELNSNTKTVTITNTGVTSLNAGTGISLNTNNGNVVISVSGTGNGTLVAGVTNVGITSSTLQIINSPIVSSGTIGVDLPVLSNIIPGTYYNPFLEIDPYGRVTSVQNSYISGTVTSVEVQNGPGISVSGGPIVSNGTITVTNTGVRRLNPGPGIVLTDTTGEITISANLSAFTGTVSRVTVTSNTLSVSNPTITLAGNINIELPTNLSVVGNVTGGGNFNVGQNISIEGNVTANGNLVLNQINANANIAANGNISVTNVNRLRVPGGTNGQFLQTDGTGNLAWVTVTQNTAAGLGSPGANTQILFNNGGVVDANANLTFDKTTGTLSAPNIIGNVSIANTANLANTANFVSNATQIAITTLGNLTSLSVVGNITTSNSIISNAFIYSTTPSNATSNTQVATTQYVQNAISSVISGSGYAPINSPVFTGTPQGPTIDPTSPGSNALATTAYVKSAIGNANISGYAPINSPAFTGVPTAPTPNANVSTNQIATTAFVQNLVANSSSGSPEYAGTIKLWAATTALPDNTWMVCDGAAVSRTTYETLFTRIGTTYGIGNGSTTFNLPDFRDRFAVGSGNLYALGSTGGSKDAIVVSHTHTATTNTTGAHTHNLNGLNNNTGGGGGFNLALPPTGSATSGYVISNGDHSHTVSVSTEGSSGTNANMPPYVGLIYIIKVTDTGSSGGTGGDNSTEVILSIYQWASSQPALPNVTSTYTWATNSFTPVPSGWTLTGGTSVTQGATLWVARVRLTNSTNAATSSFLWTTATIAAAGYAGTDGASGSKVATVQLYQWSTVQPNNPSGSSTYTWATASNGTYTGGNGWTVTVPANPGTAGIQLWSASKSITAAADAVTTSVSWASGFSVQALSQNGLAGTAGVQTTTAVVYQWAITIPSAPTGTSTYTWSTSAFTPTPAGWSLSGSTGGSEGFTLWAARVNLVDSASNTTSTINWTLATIAPIGYFGTNGTPGTPGGTGATGASARVCYTKTTLTALASTPTTITTSGDTSFPANASWGTGTVWQANPPSLAEGESLYQSDGIFSPSTNNTVWNVPYLSSLKVGSLSAITVNTGALTVNNTLTVGATGSLEGGQTDYNTGTGFFLGYSGGAYKFSIGTSTNNMLWNGSSLTVNGGTITAGTVRTAASGRRIQIDPTNYLVVWDASNNLLAKVGGTTDGILYANGTGGVLPAVYGVGSAAAGVFGIATGSGEGVFGSSNSGTGVTGSSTSGLGVLGSANTKGGGNHGVRGINYNGYGSGQSSAGLIGAANGYNFYADGASPLDYGTFTGVHDALTELADNFTIGDIVVDVEILVHSSVSSTISLVKTSTIPNQKAALGVVSMEPRPLSDVRPKAYIQGYEENPETNQHEQIMIPSYEEHCELYNIIAVNSLGEGQINVCGENGNIEAGDLIVTSSTPGKGMKQSDDIVRSITVAKSRETVTFNSPNEVKMIACIFLSG